MIERTATHPPIRALYEGFGPIAVCPTTGGEVLYQRQGGGDPGAGQRGDWFTGRRFRERAAAFLFGQSPD